MAAGVYNFTIEQGASFTRTFTAYTNTAKTTLLDLTGYTARMKIKRLVDGTVDVSLTSTSGITLGGTAGTVIVAITAAATALLSPLYAYHYDIELVNPSGAVTRLVKGVATVDPEVTT